jgi:hypothetical protein
MENIEESKIIKFNKEKEIVIDLKSMEDMLNAVNYTTAKLEKAKEGLEALELQKDFEPIKQNLELILINSTNMRDLTFPNFEKALNNSLKEVPKDETIKAMLFEMEKFQGIDSLFNKFKIKYLVAASLLSSFITLGVIGYLKIDDKFSKAYFINKIKKENWVVSKTMYEFKSNNNGIVVLKKINNKDKK